MGMYTEVYINVDLIVGTDNKTVRRLCHMIEETHYLCYNMSYYTPRTQAFFCKYDDISKQWSLMFKGDLKNYDNEITQFVEELTPHVEHYGKTFIGYTRFEEQVEPTLLYVGDDE